MILKKFKLSSLIFYSKISKLCDIENLEKVSKELEKLFKFILDFGLKIIRAFN
jgi:hypothetical protein